MAAYNFYLFTLSKAIGDAQSFLDYVLLTKLSFCILFSLASRAHPSQERLRWTEGSCSGVSIITRVANKTRNVLARECISESKTKVTRCSSAPYNQGRLTLIFNTISCGLQLSPYRVAYNRVNTVISQHSDNFGRWSISPRQV